MALAGRVKGALVDFALSPPLDRQMRAAIRAVGTEPDGGTEDVVVQAVEHLLFEFRFDDGTDVIDRFLRRPRLLDSEQEMARGFRDSVQGFFEVLEDIEAGSERLRLRCCLSDLDHLVIATEPAGIVALSRGTFLAGRLSPVAGTEVWTPSGALRVFPPDQRDAVVEAVRELAMDRPWLTHRDPAKRRIAEDRTALVHERFLRRHGADLVVLPGHELADVLAQAMATDEPSASADVVRRSIEDSHLSDLDEVMVLSHPVAGIGFYEDYSRVVRALAGGSTASDGDVEELRAYLDSRGVPAWLMRRLVVEHLPASEAALATAVRRPRFRWDRDGEELLASCQGEQEPVLAMTMMPSLCLEADQGHEESA